MSVIRTMYVAQMVPGEKKRSNCILNGQNFAVYIRWTAFGLDFHIFVFSKKNFESKLFYVLFPTFSVLIFAEICESSRKGKTRSYITPCLTCVCTPDRA